MVHRDHGRADLVGGAADQTRGPERVVQHHDMGLQLFERGLEAGAAERQAIPVRGGEGEGALLVTVRRAGGGSARDQKMVLERPRPPRERRLRLQIGTDPPAALAVEQRYIGNFEPVLGRGCASVGRADAHLVRQDDRTGRDS